MTANLLDRAADLLYREASHLDHKRWQDWLDLYESDAWFWVPAWDADGVLTDDPRREISLMFYDRKLGLEERVARIRSGRSSASTPLPRTCHLISNVRIAAVEASAVRVEASFTVHSFRRGTSETFYGFYEHELRDHGSHLTIAKKRIALLNDVIPSAIDIYSI